MGDYQNSYFGNLNDSKILVNVDHALENALVVSYAFESRLFQGVLLDSTNRYIPCSGTNLEKQVIKSLPEPQLNKVGDVPPTTKADSPDADKPFYSLCRRFTYFQDVLLQRNIAVQKSNKATKNKSQKMTVRLRPRQVLCSKCKSICNENSENVHSNKGQATSENPSKSPRPLLVESSQENHTIGSPNRLRSGLVPLARLDPGDITNPINGCNSNEPVGKACWLDAQAHLGKDDLYDEAADRQMVLRKKRSVGSMEDLWDETVFEEASKKAKTPIIKISFGSPGEGTVLKIPPKLQTCSGSEDEEEEEDVDVAKAFKKALKKAKKEAKRKFSFDNSPDRTIREATPANQINYKKHRHKVKHKKKHKGEKGIEEEVKERCLKQKLSINLKRLTSSTVEEESGGESGGESSKGLEPIPEFPASCAPPSHDVTSCQNSDGSTLTVGDVVWGKIHGFPWWPGKVESLCPSSGDGWNAQVSWYGSATSTLMSSDQLSPFLQNFKTRFNRKKKSTGYKEAIKLATTEASKHDLPQTPLTEINELLAL